MAQVAVDEREKPVGSRDVSPRPGAEKSRHLSGIVRLVRARLKPWRKPPPIFARGAAPFTSAQAALHFTTWTNRKATLSTRSNAPSVCASATDASFSGP